MAVLFFAGQNERLRRQLQEVAEALGMEFHFCAAVETVGVDAEPAMVVVELELKGAVAAISDWKTRWPQCMVAGSIAFPVQEIWHAATAAGCDLVCNRGAIPRQIRLRVESYVSGQEIVKKRQRLKVLCNQREGDGPVGRLPDAPDGPIAIFRIGNQLCAFRDICPHAGF